MFDNVAMLLATRLWDGSVGTRLQNIRSKFGPSLVKHYCIVYSKCHYQLQRLPLGVRITRKPKHVSFRRCSRFAGLLPVELFSR